MLFSILDTKTKMYGPLLECENVDDARRMLFQVLLKDSCSNLSLFPDDFALCSIGDFSRESGSLVPYTIKTEFIISSILKDVENFISQKKGDVDVDCIKTSDNTENTVS